MARLELRAAIAVFCTVTYWACGCTTSSPPAPASTATSKSGPPNSGKDVAATVGDAEVPTKPSKAAKPGYWDDYPDVPKFEIMTEVNGIKIPRQANQSESVNLTGKLAFDVGNSHAAEKPGEPVTGDTLTIRFPSESASLNPITVTSAVKTYIMQYVTEGLARRDMENFEYSPLLATKWVVEDSVKLSPDYPGQERRIELPDAKPTVTAEIDYVLPPPAPKGETSVDPPVMTITTTNKEGQPVGNVWVGLYPIGKIDGAPATGYHIWSDQSGKTRISGLRTGKYSVKVGAEMFGKSHRGEDGSLVVTPASEANPLRELLKSSASTSLTLKAGEWLDVHEQTYYTYHLDETSKWSDGTPFTSKDIEFASVLLRSSNVDGDSLRTYYDDLIECRPLGPHIIRMRYRQPYFRAFEFTYAITQYTPPFHYFANIFKAAGRELTLENLTPDEEQASQKISAHGKEFGKFFNTDERYNRAPLGTGPYIVDKWIKGDRVELVRNRNYWNPKYAGHVDKIIVKFVPDQVTAMAALKAGEIDFFYDMSPQQYFEDWPIWNDKLRDDFVRASWYSPMFSYIGWNQLAPQLQDRRVRIALTMMLDRQNFVDTKMHGGASVVSGTQYFFGPGYDHEVAPLAYDPETARELLSDAGWIDTDNDGILDRKGEKFSITLYLPQGRPLNTQLCEVLQKNLKSVGIELQLQTLEWASFIDKVQAKECDAITLSWTTDLESDPFQLWHSTEAPRHKRGSNSISFANPQADSLIEMLRVTPDLEKRKRIHASFHRLLDSEQPYTFLWIRKDFGVYHKRFRNVKWYRLRPGFDLSEWYVPKDEQLHK